MGRDVLHASKMRCWFTFSTAMSTVTPPYTHSISLAPKQRQEGSRALILPFVPHQPPRHLCSSHNILFAGLTIQGTFAKLSSIQGSRSGNRSHSQQQPQNIKGCNTFKNLPCHEMRPAAIAVTILRLNESNLNCYIDIRVQCMTHTGTTILTIKITCV